MTAALVLDGMRVPVEIGGNNRRARLTVERDGSLRLRAAQDVATGELEAFLASKRKWIYKKLAEKETLQYKPVTKELVDGEGFLYLGRSHRLRLDDVDDSRVRIHRGRLVLPRPIHDNGYERIVAWYQRRGLAWLRPRAEAWSNRLGVEPGLPEVADLGHKWGVATADGRVRIHWATMQLAPALIDYVLAHELAHLREAHHGPDFWTLLGRVLPDYDDRRTELAHVGSRLWLGTKAMQGQAAQ